MHLTNEQIIEQALGDEIPGAAAHVMACAECEAEVQAYRDVWALTREVPGPPPGYADKMWERIQWRLGPPPRRRRWPTILAIAASVMLAVVAGVLIWRERHVPAERMMTAPQAQTPPKVRQHMSITVTPADDPETKKRMAIVDATTNPHKLAELARHDPALAVRLEAIRVLGFVDDRESSGYLVDIYRHAREPEARQYAVMALLMHKDTASVALLESEEKDPAVKSNISGMLASYRATAKMHQNEEPPPVEPARNRKPPR